MEKFESTHAPDSGREMQESRPELVAQKLYERELARLRLRVGVVAGIEALAALASMPGNLIRLAHEFDVHLPGIADGSLSHNVEVFVGGTGPIFLGLWFAMVPMSYMLRSRVDEFIKQYGSAAKKQD